MNRTIPGLQSAEPRTHTTRLKENRTHHTVSELRHVCVGWWRSRIRVEDKLIRDVQTARKQEERARERLHWKENHRHYAARDREKENDQGKGIVYQFEHSGVEAVLRQTGIREARQPAAALASLLRAQ